MVWLSDISNEFPDVSTTAENGVIALGGDLNTERLINAYENGIFPWYSENEPIIWHCPDPRMVLFFEDLKISKSMRKIIREQTFTVTYNQNFEEVIYNCKTIDRNDGYGTWITDDILESYIKLHKKGIAKSIEVWQNKKLVGGLYGVDLENVFCGESMYSKVSNASKFGFIHLAKKLQQENYHLLDCQVYNEHLASLGAKEIPRKKFLNILKK